MLKRAGTMLLCGLVHSVGGGSLETHHLMLALPDESSDSTITLQGLLDDSTAPREMSGSLCASCSQLTSSQQVTFISEVSYVRGRPSA